MLTAALAPVRLGFGTMLELVGEAGVGKTRLLQELRANADDLRVIGARCDEYERSTPYFVFRDLLRPLDRLSSTAPPPRTRPRCADWSSEVAPELVPWIPLLALPLDVEVDCRRRRCSSSSPRSGGHGCTVSSRSSCASLLPDPTLLLLEDVHWIDEASSELLRHLGSTNATRPWAICCARRPGDEGFVAANGVPPVAAMTILLEPLHDDEAAELVRAAAGDAARRRRRRRARPPRRRQPALPAGARQRRRQRRHRPSCPTRSTPSWARASTASRRGNAPCCAGPPCSASSSTAT